MVPVSLNVPVELLDVPLVEPVEKETLTLPDV